jgi:hypothetical protein
MAATTLYEMPTQSPYQRPFRVFAASAVIALLLILCLAMWEPEGLSDGTRKMFTWIAGAIVVSAVVVGNQLGFKQGLLAYSRKNFICAFPTTVPWALSAV